jgi:hypothetical protein
MSREELPEDIVGVKAGGAAVRLGVATVVDGVKNAEQYYSPVCR